MKKLLSFIIATIIMSTGLSLQPNIANAGTTNFGIDKATQNNLPNTSPEAFVGTIIRWTVGIMGTILIALLVYAGFMYATAAGNEQRTETAKQIITWAIVGIAIVAAAGIVSEFVISAAFSNPQTGNAFN